MKQQAMDQINRIIGIMLTDGVQPCDLASNLFDSQYSSMKIAKLNGVVVADITFDEIVSGIKRQHVTLRYTYNESKQLTRVEEVKAQSIIVQWDRENVISDLLDEVICILKTSDASSATHFIANLPPYLADKVASGLAIAA